MTASIAVLLAVNLTLRAELATYPGFTWQMHSITLVSAPRWP